MKWNREQYIELMTFGRAERPMFSELFGPLVGLPEEWRAQGASDDEIDMVGFDWDYRACWDLVSSRGTRLENYRYYVRRGREILGLPPLDGKAKGWGRMAF
jgi:hypothetical protein